MASIHARYSMRNLLIAMFHNVNLLFTNKILLFTANRYFCYFLMFVRGMLVAKFLGPYFFGIWGFINLVLSYLSYTSMGIQFAINVELSTKDKDNRKEVAVIIGNSLILTLCVCAVLLCMVVAVKIGGVEIFPSYSFSQYTLLAVFIASLNHITQVFANIYRAYGYLFRIAFNELILSVSTFLCVFMFSGVDLIEGIMFAMTGSGLISIMIYIIKSPIPIRPCINIKIAKQLLSKGLSLLIYNVSFYLIMVTGRTIISIFYSVEELGYFSLANSITAATLLGLGSITWVLFPKFLWKLRTDIPAYEASAAINKITRVYSPVVYLIVFGAIMLSPLLFLYLTEYKPLAPALNYLLLSQAVLSSCIGYSSIAISRNRQNAVAKISLMAVAIVAVIGTTVAFLKLDFTFVALTVFIAICFYSLLQTKVGKELVEEDASLLAAFNQILPFNFVIPILIIVAGNLLGYYEITGFIGFAAFLMLNYKNIFWSFRESRDFLVKMSGREREVAIFPS